MDALHTNHSPSMPWAGKAVAVTGGAKGIGRAICRAFAQAGATVYLADIDEKAALENESFIRQTGGQCVSVPVDVSSQSDVLALKRRIEEGGLPLGALVNNAGFGHSGDPTLLPIEAFDRVLAVNLRGTFLCARTLAPLMPPGSAIVNIASTRAAMSEPFTEAYSASKGGVAALTHSLAVSFAPRKIRVNCVSPGWIDVSGWQDNHTPAQPLTESDHAQHPAGRVGVPEDIAHACLFLCGAEAGFITGTNLTVDGGMTIKMIYTE